MREIALSSEARSHSQERASYFGVRASKVPPQGCSPEGTPEETKGKLARRLMIMGVLEHPPSGTCSWSEMTPC